MAVMVRAFTTNDLQSVTFGEFGDTVTRVCMGKTIAEALAER